MRISSLVGRPLFGVCLIVSFAIAAASAAVAEEKIVFCHAGLITLPKFEKHIKDVRAARRYEDEDINKLIAGHRKGGDEFFSSQVIVQEEYSGSGTFSLRQFHGILGSKLRNVSTWACDSKDYPVVYFIGFRVREIDNNTIFVSREKDITNTISLKTLDPNLDKHISVKIFQSDKVLCRDIAEGCDDRIFYGRHG